MIWRSAFPGRAEELSRRFPPPYRPPATTPFPSPPPLRRTPLDAPRRALTAALNAQLTPQLKRLLEAVRAVLAATGIGAPLMVVKGDGSLMASEVALECPVETILSGPAASVVGAAFLTGLSD